MALLSYVLYSRMETRKMCFIGVDSYPTYGGVLAMTRRRIADHIKTLPTRTTGSPLNLNIP